MPSQLPSTPTEKRLSLMDLPDELLEQIVLDVADQDRLALYRDVVYVNKTLNRIASPHVARHSPIRCMKPKVPPTPTHLLLLHLFRHPEQAKNVRTLFAKSYDEDGLRLSEWREYLGRLTDVESFEKIAAAAQETCQELANSSQWCRQLSDGDVNASVALLLAWCTRIVKLDYEIPFRSNMIEKMTLRLVNMTAKNVIAGTMPSLHPLSHLEHVVLRQSGSTFFWDHQQNIVYAAPFFYLPTVKSLATSKLGTGHALQDTSDDGPDWVADYPTGHTPLDPALYISEFPVGTSPIETLILHDASFRQPGFLVLVRACKRLKKLALHIDSDTTFNVRASLQNNLEVAWLEDLSKAIAYHSSSLEEVTFGFKYSFHWETFRYYHETTAPLAVYDCLKNMQRLKRLTIQIEFLYQKVADDLFDCRIESVTDRLPPTLEHLVLKKPSRVDSCLLSKKMKLCRTLLGQCGPGGRFGKLQSLTVPIWYLETKAFPILEELDELKVLAGSKGVLVIFEWEHGDEVTPTISSAV